MYAPNTPTTGTREGDYEAIADNVLQILLDTKPQRRVATPIFLIGMSRGAGGMLYALERLARIEFAEEMYGRVTRAIAFAPRGTTVGRILSQETWQRVTTPAVIVSPSKDVITPQIDTVGMGAGANGITIASVARAAAASKLSGSVRPSARASRTLRRSDAD